ncbi:GerMN domain-containing protein [Chroococcidiopsis sp. CCNUC1]|jgi:spore germination protein GerM|uniref:GerMN domain-containing protein n=1 Tax=Chroococcidiopsis sp. CCNUC1 TaxID=2653189 RepID=UPI002020A212|nr:GerMN domain-containing protein [Chroococcidiopsis sp. CCNUC1]URD53365.1 GerMN domain-containing protein [Chroococcidiopsis sp. CCNUC1]
MSKQPARSGFSGLIAAIAAVVVVAGGGTAWWIWHSTKSPSSPTTPNTVQQSPSPSVQPKVEQTAQVFWLKDTGSNQELISEAITTTADRQPSTMLKAAFNSLLAGPQKGEVTTTIPARTKLRNVKVEPDGVRVNLSEEFTTGGGSAAMIGRLAQVIYTATSLDPKAKVWIEVEGKPLEVLGGEGLELEQPLTRRSFEENFTL